MRRCVSSANVVDNDMPLAGPSRVCLLHGHEEVCGVLHHTEAGETSEDVEWAEREHMQRDMLLARRWISDQYLTMYMGRMGRRVQGPPRRRLAGPPVREGYRDRIAYGTKGESVSGFASESGSESDPNASCEIARDIAFAPMSGKPPILERSTSGPYT
jgi:hypothetical protein